MEQEEVDLEYWNQQDVKKDKATKSKAERTFTYHEFEQIKAEHQFKLERAKIEMEVKQ